MSIHQLAVPGRKPRGIIHVSGDAVAGFTVCHESESGSSWGEPLVYPTGDEAITAAFALNRDTYDGVCAVWIGDAAMEHANPGVGFVSLPGDF